MLSEADFGSPFHNPAVRFGRSTKINSERILHTQINAFIKVNFPHFYVKKSHYVDKDTDVLL